MDRTSESGSSSLRLWVMFLSFFLTNIFFIALFYLTLAPSRQETVKVRIPAGASLGEISRLLAENRVIKSRLAFELMTKLRHLDTGLRAGDYAIPPESRPWEVITLLTTGQGEQVRLTLPEGLTDKEVLERIHSALPALDRDRLLGLAAGNTLAGELGLAGPGLTGYLFPDTYFVPPNIDEAGVLRLMAGHFLEVYRSLAAGPDPPQDPELRGTVILASIIEKEAVRDSERSIISSVFLNRLAADRPLESCATVLYVLGKHKSRLLYRDLEVQSPYNTYLHKGLPPGPICNPGRESLAAALQPARTDYLYFVARGDGGHVFSRSLEEHARAKRRYRAAGPGR